MNSVFLKSNSGLTIPVSVGGGLEQGAEMLKNGDFTSGESFWSTTGAVSHSVSSAQLNVQAAGGQALTAVKTVQNVIVDKAGHYRIKADLKADVNGATMSVRIGGHTGNAVLTTSLVTYTFDLSGVPVTPGAQMALFWGGNAGTVNFTTDNVFCEFTYFPVRLISDLTIDLPYIPT